MQRTLSIDTMLYYLVTVSVTSYFGRESHFDTYVRAISSLVISDEIRPWAEIYLHLQMPLDQTAVFKTRQALIWKCHYFITVVVVVIPRNDALSYGTFVSSREFSHGLNQLCIFYELPPIIKQYLWARHTT